MNQEKILKTLLAPIVSEKTTQMSANNQYAFKVRGDSDKKEIKTAVKSLFNVDVLSVKTMNVKGKHKIFKGKVGKRVNWKKAIVKVSEGQMINVSGA